ncbi:MAG: ethanolamine utilization protein EutA [Gammaproteobacteria bacterium]|nr:ethanolamine utilization protein EutA [Gammaproteobacteria bacterium]
MMSEPIRFTSADRALVESDIIEVLTLGLDIGSATSHVSISRLTMVRGHNRYTVSSTEVVYQSPVIKTPFGGDGHAFIIRTDLESMIDDSLLKAHVDRDDIESGVVILTGNALRRHNARQIADLLASFSGKFISISAGDRLESTMAAYGSGTVQESVGGDCLNVDIGGGTTKITRCVDGKVTELTAIEVGGRILQFTDDGYVGHAEPNLALYTANNQLPEYGSELSAVELEQIIDRMAQTVLGAVQGYDLGDAQRLDSITEFPTSGTVILSGGVSQWITNIESSVECDDLGQRLAFKTRDMLEDAGYKIEVADDPIRATVLGASQQRMQVSGNTVFISDERLLPIRNAPVSSVTVPAEDFDQHTITRLVKDSVSKALFNGDHGLRALGIDWLGSLTYSRADAFCRGVIEGLKGLNTPITLLFRQDIAGLIGIHFVEEMGYQKPVICLDGLDQVDFDFVDIGEVINQTGLVPVVAKSILFNSGSKLN